MVNLFYIYHTGLPNINVEEKVGFEPTVPFRTSVFKTDAIDRSAISPLEWCPLPESNQQSLITKQVFCHEIKGAMFRPLYPGPACGLGDHSPAVSADESDLSAPHAPSCVAASAAMTMTITVFILSPSVFIIVCYD